MLTYRDIKPRGSGPRWTPDSNYQSMLINKMVDNLTMLQSKLPRGCKLVVVEGVVDPDIIKSRIEGESVDHLFGKVCKSDIEHISDFGSNFPFSVGAVDLTVTNMYISELFKIIVTESERTHLRIGHAALHRGYADCRPWIHINNDPYEVFGPDIGTMLRRHSKYTLTDDGASTFREYEMDGRRRK